MADLIDRQAAIDATSEIVFVEYEDGDPRKEESIILQTKAAIRDRIKALPTVQPKHGKWVFKTVFPNDTSEFPMGYLVCSECGSKHSNKTPCNFCDNCGADMRGKSDADNY